MATTSNKIPKGVTRALQIWPILVSQASNHQTVTYRSLAKMLGLGGPHAFPYTLSYIRDYCHKNNLPPLSMLVVSEIKGVPNAGLQIANFNDDTNAVFEFDWHSIVPPTPEELKEAHRGASNQ